MEGGVVPKNLYRLDLEAASNDHEHSLYHSISLAHGQVHHVAINTNDPGAVLTWDFDVMRHNVIFTVLYEKPDAANTNGNYLITDKKYILLIYLFFVTESLEVTSADSDSLKEWKEGVNCVKVESSVVCHDGESIQVKKKIFFYLILP